MKSAQLNVGVIGCGGHAHGHFQMIAAEPRLRLAAIAEIDPQRLERVRAEQKPERAFRDYREMLATCDLDVVYVVTLPAHLTQIVLDCLERDLHVSVEKPPGMNSAETAHMAAAARRHRGKVIVSLNRRYIPQVLAVRRLAKECGGTVHCSATYNKPVTVLGFPPMAALIPDPVICDAIHHVDLLRWLAGAAQECAALPVAVYSEVQEGERPRTHRHNAVVRFDNGAIGTLMSHYGVGYRIQRAEIHAEDLSAYLDLTGEPQCEVYRARPEAGGTTRGERVPTPLDLAPVGGAGFDETRHFVDCILENHTPWSTLDDAVVTMKLCEAIRQGHKGKFSVA